MVLLCVILLLLNIVCYTNALYNNKILNKQQIQYNNNNKLFANINNDAKSSNSILSNKIIKYTQSTLIALTASVLTTTTVTSKVVNAETTESDIKNILPQITDKVYLNIRIANYTEESVGKNRPGAGSGRVVFGLYGKVAPKACQLFLDTIKSDGSETPCYYNNQFSKVSEEGLLMITKMSRLNSVQLAGQEQLEYNGNIMSYDAFIENSGISHNRRGLLSRKQLNRGPEFSITLRSAPELDSFHEVFGCVLEGEEVLDAISSIPTYTYTTGTGYASKEKGVESGLTDAWFEGQKKLFVGAGQLAGDLRAVDRRGKLLRRSLLL